MITPPFIKVDAFDSFVMFMIISIGPSHRQLVLFPIIQSWTAQQYIPLQPPLKERRRVEDFCAMDYDRGSARWSGINSRGQSQTNRSNQYNDSRGGEPEWESSFSQILTRTKQNINRVNEKYGGNSSVVSSRTSYDDSHTALRPE